MEISKENFTASALKQGLSQEKIDVLWTSLETQNKIINAPQFSKWLFYFGAMVIISAMTWMFNLAWDIFQGKGIFLISVAYAIFFLFLGAKLWKNEELRTPAGLFVTIAVCMIPLAIFGLEIIWNRWPEVPEEEYKNLYQLVSSNWIFMDLGAIIGGIIALRFFAFPFLTAPIFFFAWYLSMDIYPFLTEHGVTWKEKEWISLAFGLCLLIISYLIHLSGKKEYAFWGYLFGTIIFWSSLGSLCWENGEVPLFIYFIINLLMMPISILLRTKVFMIFGAIGTFSYLGHLAYKVFEDAFLFPFVMTLIGLGIIYLGILYQRNSQRIENKLSELIPIRLRQLIP